MSGLLIAVFGQGGEICEFVANKKIASHILDLQ